MDFDPQASSYDERTGFPGDAVAPIVDAFCAMVPGIGDATLLELGAGTGTLGLALAPRVRSYIGMDRSGAMLEQSTSTGALPPGMAMLVADVDETWSVESGSVQCFFTSRALHLFDPDHVCAELRRTADPAGAVFIVGRVLREKESVQSEMRREMRHHLQAAGYEPRDGQRAWKQLEAVLRTWNGKPLPQCTAAHWTRRRSPARMLSSWENKPGLGGLDIPEEEKAMILRKVRAWAKDRYNDPEAPCDIQESYILQGVAFNINQ